MCHSRVIIGTRRRGGMKLVHHPKKNVTLWTDGACSGNPGPGGWGAILIYNGVKKELSGGESMTTNQRMEIMAVCGGLEALKESCDVVIHSDSAYVVNCFQQKWYVSWQAKGWKNSKGQPVQNRDLWERLLKAVEPHDIRFEKVKGHAGVELNERCDELARQAIPS